MSLPEPPHPPPATVTMSFLLTDIEGSTALWEYPDVFPLALDRHHALLHEVVARHGGRELSEAGDGFLVAFEQPRTATECALALQRAFATAAWPAKIGNLRVRMALHVGPVEPLENGEFRGLTLNRAARLRDGAHGGQIVCSAAVAEALAGDFEVRELGLFQLRGLPAPERVFQLEWTEMTPREFPPLRLSPAFTNNLPPAFTRFFGREAEVARLREWILRERARPAAGVARAGQLITLTGPGGTGKTRLSLALAESLLEAFSHAVWFVPLADVAEAARLPTAVRDVLRLAPDPAQEPVEQVLATLAAQPAVLVLDNFEQLGESGAPFVQTLLARLPALHCVVTSRHRFGLAGEREHAVPPLPVPGSESAPPDELLACESVQLFVDRAQLAHSGFELTAKNAPAVAELCRKLEGVPLALELAAARADVVSPRAMLTQLDRRLDAFRREDAAAPARHRSLRAAIEWSYEFLPPALQEFFANLSVFRGGWTAEAAEAVAAPAALGAVAANVLRALGELRASSLITAGEEDEAMRFRMLETIRQFAAERLAGCPGAGEIRRRCGAYFLHLAEDADQSMRSADQMAWLALLDREAENVRAVLGNPPEPHEQARLVAALPHYWTMRGLTGEGWRWAQQVCARTQELPPPLRAGVHNAAGILAFFRSEFAEARRHFEETLAYFREIGDARNVAGLLNNLGAVSFREGDLAAARDFFAESLQAYGGGALQAQRAQALSNLGSVLADLSDSEAACRCFEECLPIQREQGDLGGCAMTLQSLARVALMRAETERAEGLAHEGFEIARRLRLRPLLAMSASLRAWAAMQRRQAAEAARWLGAADYFRGEEALVISPCFASLFAEHEQAVRGQLSEEEHARLRRRAFERTAAWFERHSEIPLDTQLHTC